jgi:hypothetical protein
MLNRRAGPIEDAYLLAYPNPERIGCPPDDVRFATLRALARRELPIDDPYREHLSHCSPCFQEYAPLRDAYWAERTRAKTMGVAAVVLLLIGGSIAAYVLTHRVAPQRAPQNVVANHPAASWKTVALNYRDASGSRSADPSKPALEQSAPPAPDALKIALPFASDDGQYEVQVRTGQSENAALKTWNGIARIQDGYTLLEVDADLSAFAPGHYILAYRHADASWRLVPLRIE